MFFLLLYAQCICQTTYSPSYTMKKTSKVQSEHMQSLHYMNIKVIFYVLELYQPPIKFHFATLDFTLSCVISL